MSNVQQAPAPPAPTSSSNASWGPWETAGFVVAVASGLACGYHGYVRNDKSAGWGFAWALLGFAVPIVTVPVAVVQGFGEPSDDVRLKKIEGALQMRPELAAALAAEQARQGQAG